MVKPFEAGTALFCLFTKVVFSANCVDHGASLSNKHIELQAVTSGQPKKELSPNEMGPAWWSAVEGRKEGNRELFRRSSEVGARNGREFTQTNHGYWPPLIWCYELDFNGLAVGQLFALIIGKIVINACKGEFQWPSCMANSSHREALEVVTRNCRFMFQWPSCMANSSHTGDRMLLKSEYVGFNGLAVWPTLHTAT